MAINLPSGLNITTDEAVDSRILLTKEQMKNIADAKMPDKYFCICLDDGNLYIYNLKIKIYFFTKPHYYLLQLFLLYLLHL